MTDIIRQARLPKGAYNKSLAEIIDPYRGKPQQKRYCAKHPTARWGRNPYNNQFWPRCAQGNKLNEDCIVGE